MTDNNGTVIIMMLLALPYGLIAGGIASYLTVTYLPGWELITVILAMMFGMIAGTMINVLVIDTIRAFSSESGVKHVR